MKTNKLTDADLQKVMEMFQELEAPDTLWYLKVSWKRPIKRLKQEYQKWLLKRL